MLNLRTEIMPFVSNALDCLLTKAAIRRELIKTDEMLRGLGKTTALVKFAEKCGFYVVVATLNQAAVLKKTLGYMYVLTTEELQYYKKKPVVIDECVDKDVVQRLGFEVITGYQYEAEARTLPDKSRVLLEM
ncbi:hypothetical protein [Thermaerobacillus caldiproteolyticus]|uniref:hypothetical protein n=1 Tax=Thermaerobacillus caldiproteolyticus TaxID=247480 RepID=UPI00188D4FF4|nr:hypothetical protein [Anoxybacillus caldiproteolyticus]QPA33421.1 hypothetical protein ISX45_19055 [Anoxybacillus caldiproteolyticus]